MDAAHRTTVYDHYGLPQFGIELDPIRCNDWSVAEHCRLCCRTWRAAISIDKGQWEAAASIDETCWWQTMRRGDLRQAARVALPPLSNSFISLVKDTSLAATIQVPELFRQAQLITSRTLEVFTMYLAVCHDPVALWRQYYRCCRTIFRINLIARRENQNECH